jgi:hypothetical protein
MIGEKSFCERWRTVPTTVGIAEITQIKSSDEHLEQ